MKTRQIPFGSIQLGSEQFCMITGPCSIESLDHFRGVAKHVKATGGHALRGGIFKLRTSPESFQGLETDGYGIAMQVRKEMNMPLVSEVTDPRQIEEMLDFVDCFQVGARNMYNYSLLKELGQTRRPVLLKRGFSARIDEWLHAADYVLRGGNDQVILCERGIRTFETKMRNTFDLNTVAWLKQNTPFPVIADPSHGTGSTSLVAPMALAAAAAGADGLLIEIHPNPAKAMSDGFQALNFEQYSQLVHKLENVLPHFGRKLTTTAPAVSTRETFVEATH